MLNASRSIGRHAWIALPLLCTPLLPGCHGVDTPDIPPLYDVAYVEELAVPATGDTVLLAIATGWTVIPSRDVGVYLDTRPSADDSVRFSIRVVGRAHDRGARGVIDHWWRDDTLVVWCSEYAPNPWDREGRSAKTTPENSWFAADRVDVAVPGSVRFRYVGRLWPRGRA